jgi:hypothetical protein
MKQNDTKFHLYKIQHNHTQFDTYLNYSQHNDSQHINTQQIHTQSNYKNNLLILAV